MSTKHAKVHIINSNNEFSIDVHWNCLAHYSYFASNNATQSVRVAWQVKRRNIFVGGYDPKKVDDGFYELIVDDKTNSIDYRSFTKNYNKKFANIKHIGLDRAKYTHAYLVHKNKFLIVFCGLKCTYNVYDMENDKWLIKFDEMRDCQYVHARSVLINDELIIISVDRELHLYSIANDHITDPLFVDWYTLQLGGTTRVNRHTFSNHGMSIIDFKKHYNNKNNNIDRTININNGVYSCKLKMLLFGGMRALEVVNSFTFVDIDLVYILNSPESDTFKLLKFKCKDNVVNMGHITYKNTNYYKMSRQLSQFGYKCICNSKNETIVVTFGGATKAMSRKIYLYNCITNKIADKGKVKY